MAPSLSTSGRPPSLQSLILPKLRPFQREAFEFAVSGKVYDRQFGHGHDQHQQADDTKNPAMDPSLLGKGRILLADEMGLGKTVTSLAIMSHYEHEWDPFLLIVCPASLKHVWPAEIERFFPTLPPKCVHICQGFSDIDWPSHTKILIVTYSLLQARSAIPHKLKELDVKCIIVDESHCLKQKDSQRTKNLLPLLIRARRLTLLSGTPALAKPVELWTQLYVLAPKLFGTWTQFVNLYCNPTRKSVGRGGGYHQQQMVWDYSGSSNALDLHKKLRNVMVRRLKSAVLTELPPKQRSIVPVTMDASSKAACAEAMKELNDTNLLDGAEEAGASAFTSNPTAVTKAYQMTGIGKAHSAAAYLIDWLAGCQEKILVFCHHTAVLDVIEQALFKDCPNAHIRIDGKTPNAIRGELVNKFQICSRIRVGLLSMTAAGVGLTLTAAATVLFVELHWTPGVLAQAEDRVHRIGQTHSSVQIFYMICKDERLSLDMIMWKMLGRKIGTVDSVIDGKTCTPYLFAASEQEQASIIPQSGQNELVAFFAESSATVDSSRGKKKTPVRGSIMDFFRHAKKKEAEKLPAASEDGLVEEVSDEAEHFEQDDEASTTWACAHCTFVNSSSGEEGARCSVCASERRSTSPSEQTRVKVSSTAKKMGNKRKRQRTGNPQPDHGGLFAINGGLFASRVPQRERFDEDTDSDLDESFYRPALISHSRSKEPNEGSSMRFAESEEEAHIYELADPPSGERDVAWTCTRCTLDNSHPKSRDGRYVCVACEMVWHSSTSALPCTTANDAERQHSTSHRSAKRVSLDNDVIVIDGLPKSAANETITIDSDSDDESVVHVCPAPSTIDVTEAIISVEEPAPESHTCYRFSVSKNTGRVTIHFASTGESTHVSFDIKDVITSATADQFLDGRVKHASMQAHKFSVDFDHEGISRLHNELSKNSGQLPLSSTTLAVEIPSFVRHYLGLRETERKAVRECGHAVVGSELPRLVATLVSSAFDTTDRYVGGAKEQATERAKTGIASERDEAVLEGGACAWCGKYLQSATLRAEGIYCSQSCGEEGRLRRGGLFASRNIRAAVFALEAGVCTLCGIDAHRLYEEVRGLEPALRLNRLMRAKWKLPKSRNGMDNLLGDPKEGDFWQVDHIKAVSEGGGGCGLENLRTLCVPCHQKETDDLKKRLKLRGPVEQAEDGARQAGMAEYFSSRK